MGPAPSALCGVKTFPQLNVDCTIYTIILLKSVCRCSQTAGRNSCSIVSRNVSNCSYRLTVYPVMSSHLYSALHFLYAKNIQNYSEYCVAHASGQLNRTSDAGNCGHGLSPPTSRNGNELSGDNILWSRLIASGPSERRQHEQRQLRSKLRQR